MALAGGLGRGGAGPRWVLESDLGHLRFEGEQRGGSKEMRLFLGAGGCGQQAAAQHSGVLLGEDACMSSVSVQPIEGECVVHHKTRRTGTACGAAALAQGEAQHIRIVCLRAMAVLHAERYMHKLDGCLYHPGHRSWIMRSKHYI